MALVRRYRREVKGALYELIDRELARRPPEPVTAGSVMTAAPVNVRVTSTLGDAKEIMAAEPGLTRPADEIGWLNNYFLKETPPPGELLKVVKRDSAVRP